MLPSGQNLLCDRRYGIARWPRRDLLKAAKQQREAAVSSDQQAGLAAISNPITIPPPSKLQAQPGIQVSQGRGHERASLTASNSADRLSDQA